MFKGYIITANKRAISKFKDVNSDELLTYEQVKSLPEFAGVLDENTILIDVDNEMQSNILLNIIKDLNIKSEVRKTTKGMHFYFNNTKVIKRNKTKTQTALGLNLDIKCGKRSSYSVLKFDNKEREKLLSFNELDEVPKFLLPIDKKVDFFNLKDGDGRNQTLFNYILVLQEYELTVDEIRYIIRLINKYIIKEPLSEEELEIILRDEAFSQQIFFIKNTFQFDKFARYMKNTYNIKNVNGQLSIYKDGIYIAESREIESKMIEVIEHLNKTRRNEVLAYLEIICNEEKIKSNEHVNFIAFENGLYNLNTDKLVDFNEKYIVTNKINFKYNANAKSKTVDDMLKKLACDDENVIKLLEEVIGYCFYRRNELGETVMLTGDGANGKSTFLALLIHLLGEENISSLDLKELSEKFQNAEIVGKLANIGDDIEDEFVVNVATFKKLATGDRMQVQRKGERPFEFNNYAKLIFSANEVPRIKDKSGAIKRRLTIVPFNAKFKKDDKDFNPYIKYELMKNENIEYLILLGIKGLKRLLLNKGFTKGERVKQELKKYEERNNPISVFFEECGKIENEKTSDVYIQYKLFCSDNNLQALSKIEFSRRVCKKFNFVIKVTKISSKTYRVFVKDAEKGYG